MHFVDFYILPIDLCVVHISQNIGGADCGEMKIQNTEQVISIIYNCNQQFLYISKFHNGKAKAVLQRRVVLREYCLIYLLCTVGCNNCGP